MDKVLVVNGYVRANAGDAALMDVCLNQARQAFPTADVVVASMEHPLHHPVLSEASNIGSIRRYVSDDSHALPIRLLRKGLGVVLGILYLLSPRVVSTALLGRLPEEVQTEVRAAREADLVVSMGGGYVHGRGGLLGWQNLYFVFLPILIAQRHGTLTVFAPQSFGPFQGGAWQERFVRRVITRATVVIAREAKSVKALQQCGVPDSSITRGVDSAFALESPRVVPQQDRLLPPRVVGVTARNWLPPEEQHQYEVGLARTIDFLLEEGFPVMLVPQVTAEFMQDDDRIVEARIQAMCNGSPMRLDEQLPYTELLEVYSRCYLFIGTRFHSVIFSLLNRVPCAAIEYEHKTSGIMRDLGLAEWTIKIEDVTAERLTALVRRLIDGRQTYLDHLDDVLPAYVAESRSFITTLRNLEPKESPSPGLVHAIREGRPQ